jgi:hypothetical protein
MKPILRAAANRVAGRARPGRRPKPEGTGCRKSCAAAGHRLRFAVDGLTADSIIRPAAGTKPWTLMHGQSGTVRSICLHSLDGFDRGAVARPCFIGTDAFIFATNGQVRKRPPTGAGRYAGAVHSASQMPGFVPAGSPADRRADRAGPMRHRSYDRPRNATKITPAIASRPPHTVSIPGRSPVSAIDRTVATAGVR